MVAGVVGINAANASLPLRIKVMELASARSLVGDYYLGSGGTSKAGCKPALRCGGRVPVAIHGGWGGRE